MATIPSELRTVAFGGVDGRLWGGALDAGTPALVFGADGNTGSAAGAPAIAWSRDGAGWRLEGDGFELVISPVVDGEAEADALEELCTVSGWVVLDGVQHEVKCPGTRSFTAGLEVGEIESLRGVSGWFADDDAVSLLALRPAGSAGSDRDLLAATMFTPDGLITVDEPRLSTTYGGDGVPTRANLELWFGQDEEQSSRRAAAEALSPGGEVQADGIQLRVAPLSCHSRGLDGVGVLLLARF